MLKHWVYMLRATIWLVLAFARARWYFSTRALADLNLPADEMLTSKEKRRLEHYFYGGTFLSIIFSVLRGRTRTAVEKHRLTNLAALAYYFDDLVDAYRGRDDSGQLWENNPEEFGAAADDHRQLALHFLQNIYAELPPDTHEIFRQTMHKVFNIETAGRQELNSDASLEQINQITGDKGGNSVLLFRLGLDPVPDEKEALALHEFGYLIQYCDDIFDVWLDHQEGIATVPTLLLEMGKLGELKNMFETQVRKTQSAFRAVDAAPYRIETALCVIHYITAISRVCLSHYQDLLKNSATLPLENRTAMVVDMEKWPNRLKTAWILAFKP